ncbi:hypothetical protein F5144DRAFT_629763 [Chaetomium tenue]|uniref:Uncharacterized protein n=1 Tax=Chaetomium tenue TaxID=1854479 RepID=A0ACB7PC86_9PEZI|nr:hypothetical protein F5144DRAFT_629763 [Chaetomium globosum]
MFFHFVDQARQLANTFASVANPETPTQTQCMIETPEPSHKQRTLDLGLAQAKGFVSMVASEAAISDPPAVGSNVNWRFVTRGMDLVLTSSHEFASREDADPNIQLERSTYINGAQHILRGIPRNLTPDESAMLRRALPRSLAQPDTGPISWWRRLNGQPQDAAPAAGGAGGRGQQNMVQSLLAIVLYCLYVLAMRLENLGVKVLAAEREHAYASRLLLATFDLACLAVRMLRECSELWPCQTLLGILKYVAVGVLGAFVEVWERVVVEEVARRDAITEDEAEENDPPVLLLPAPGTKGSTCLGNNDI